MKFSLKKRNPRSSDWSFHKSYRLGSAPLPDELVFLSPILNQGELDECTDYSSVATRYNETNNTTIDPAGFWAQECAFAGTDGSQGFDIQVPAATAVENGFPNYKPSSYFWVTAGAGNDLFDNARQAIFINQRPLIGGLTFYNEWVNAPGGIISSEGVSVLGGHAIKVAGWKTINGTLYAVLQNSWGTGYGDSGLYYMTREVFNASFQPYGVFFWSDDTNPTVKILGLIQALYQHILSLLTKGTGEGSYPPAVPTQNILPQFIQGIFAAEGGGLQAGVKYNNQGDLRGRVGNKYLASLGATGYGENNLAIFPTMEIGNAACTQLVKDAASGQLLAYKPSMTIYQFITVYADPQTAQELNDYFLTIQKYCPTLKAETPINQLI